MLLVLRRHGLSVSDVGERLGDQRVTFAVTCALVLILTVVSAVVLWRLRRGHNGGGHSSKAPDKLPDGNAWVARIHRSGPGTPWRVASACTRSAEGDKQA